MKILALERENPTAALRDFTPHLKAEAAAVWQLQQTGLLRQIDFNAEQHTAVLLLECDSKEQAEQVLGQMPLVQAGLIHFEIIPLAPYDGFARLFAQNSA
ncbi:hypothetical protein ADN00_04075 [Ornatilinea apprima]|uniref:Superoxide dismutase n=1 Tax=Ornatilinea apprima TaxID=1134406 RepID=A0A0N8GNU4_9CHLR|nr:hypothetical protein [Ornatilinea apprima]KPL79066.1 hypothetical protein ADN00_04075 [Ornatilinea apprima]